MSADLFATQGTDCVRVALPLPSPSIFDYAVPPDLAEVALPGRRVRVAFRRRRLTGLILESVANTAGRKLRPIERVLDAESVLDADLIEILRETAGEVLCSEGHALHAALPAGSAPRSETQYTLTGRGSEALRSGAARGATLRILEAMADGARDLDVLERLAPDAGKTLPELLEDRLVEARECDTTPGARVATVRRIQLAQGLHLDDARASLARAPRQRELLDRIGLGGPQLWTALCNEDARAPALLRALNERGLIEIETIESPRNVFEDAPEETLPTKLTPHQSQCLGPILQAAQDRRFEPFLLHGVTGSGKTEIYLRVVADVLQQGRSALLLVPEITLTHQLVSRLRARFGDELAILHSGLRPGERLEQWLALRRGETRIAVGARSAIFAPLTDLGAIVVDEEHDPAYKNEEGFRYDARDLARKRALRAGCPLILASATPSLETRFACDSGSIQRLVLPHRVGRRPLPSVEIVDLEKEKSSAPRGRKLVLSRPLRRAMRTSLDEGGQVMLFLNRRGFSTKIFCFQCGHAERCKHCDIALVYHAVERTLRCHYCDFSIAPPEQCTGCGAGDTALLGIGTERVVEDTRELFPNARIERLDRDVARKRGATSRILRALREGEIDILVGTQMIAKGHDFPGVRLVGVVAADLGLQFPDFRAAERTFQLLTQVAGRAGRGQAPGRVIVQTFAPDHYAIAPVQNHDYERFYAQELEFRRSLAYPPFGKLAYAVVSGPDQERTEETARELAESVRQSLVRGQEPAVAVLGPAPAPLARLRDRYRFQILVKGVDAQAVWNAGRFLSERIGRLSGDISASVDVNPMNML